MKSNTAISPSRPHVAKITKRLGAKLADIYATPKIYPKLDLSSQNTCNYQKYAQGVHLGKRLFGARFDGLEKLSHLPLIERHSEKLIKQFYQSLSHLAWRWATHGLQKDPRFATLDRLDHAQKTAFATDIANTNRTLASLSGVCGFLGLKGVVLDTAWLLLVSLRTAHQVAMIYDVPLSGEQGAEMAYAVLLASDLDALTQKQVMLTALALGQDVLKHAQDSSLTVEISKIINTNPLIGEHAKTFGEFLTSWHLDERLPNLSKSRLLRVALPVLSSAVAVHYNNQLIDDVIGMAMANFGEKPPQQLTAPA